MLKKIIVFALAFLSAKEFYGQKWKRPSPPEHSTTLGISLPGILDPFDQNFTVGAEYKTSQLISAGADVGYIFSSIYTSNAQTTSGVLFRPFMRFYIDKWEESFFQVQLHYKGVTYQKRGWVDREVVNGVPSFREIATIDYVKKAYGAHLLYGNRSQLFSSNDHFLIESTIGLGYRYKKESSEIGNFRATGFVFGSRNGNSAVLLINVKMCYKL